MEDKGTGITRKLGIAATVVTLVGGSLALWKELGPIEKQKNLTGDWIIDVHIDDSNSHNYQGDTYQFEIGLAQNGNQLSGQGKQSKYNGKKGSGWKFEVLGGVMDEDSLVISYKVHSPETYTGSLRLGHSEGMPNQWQGRFTSSVDDQFGVATMRSR